MAITRSRFRELVGLDEPTIVLLSSTVEHRDDYVVETLRLRLGDTEVRGILTRPEDDTRRLPAILYGHSHGGGYGIGAAELLEGREYLLDPLGPAFARAGYVTL